MSSEDSSESDVEVDDCQVDIKINLLDNDEVTVHETIPTDSDNLHLEEEYEATKDNFERALPLKKTREEIDIMELVSQLPGRKSEITYLLKLFGKPQDRVPPLFIYGDTGTGKTKVITKLMKYMQPLYAIVNCIECFSQRSLFESIIEQLMGYIRTPDKGFKSYLRCDNAAEFVDLLSQLTRDDDQTMYIIIDRAERLRTLSATLVPVLLRLQEFVPNKNICTIFISSVLWEKFREGTGVSDPLQVHFPVYQQDDIIKILLLENRDEDPQILTSFLKLMWDYFHDFTKNIREYRNFIDTFLKFYKEPLKKGELTKDKTAILFQKFKSVAKKEVIQKVYLRELSSFEISSVDNTNDNTKYDTACFDFPINTKYLLIAAYLCSRNPAKLDTRLFGKTNRGSSNRIGANKLSDKLVGPKLFPLDRMLAIFGAISGRPQEKYSTEVYAQVTQLISMRLLTQASAYNTLDNIKLKCNVEVEFIKQLAGTINFEISQYLFDN